MNFRDKDSSAEDRPDHYMVVIYNSVLDMNADAHPITVAHLTFDEVIKIVDMFTRSGLVVCVYKDML